MNQAILPFLVPFLFWGLLAPSRAHPEDLLDLEHLHYNQQIDRIRQALGEKVEEGGDRSLISDAKRSLRWISEEPGAAEQEETRLGKKISREFLDLNLPVLIHPVPARSVLSQTSTSFSSLLLDFSTGEMKVRVSVPYFQTSGMRKAKNEAVFLAILLLQDGIMDLPLDRAHSLGQSLAGKAREPGGLMERFIDTHGLTPRHLSVGIHKLAAGGGIATARFSLPFPLHIGNALLQKIIRKTYPVRNPGPARTGKETLPYTGLILDARAFHVKPFRDPVIVSDKNLSLFVPDAGRPSDSLPYGWAGWNDGQTPEEIIRRTGPHPLVLAPVSVVNPDIFVLRERDARKADRSFRSSKLLSSGHIVILIRPETRTPALSPKGSPS